ncbi:Spore coat polysaccharide biosynthesis protein SpsC [Marine Group I thaumarchaeote SCGC AAA799-P11]|uniref:Spore coat polysaccharide biosynthesis protein SpsC n=1 Tax=Marine Group I thaumarchaeote SCGC AAA799-P11 TaxID=1502295 RepID=A0A087RZ95_9ARCH|nr:Spore coat polysaccharide biosynthesis protein SpsC [Marine Group I thaumarchaeote SCGC AAA799-P11]
MKKTIQLAVPDIGEEELQAIKEVFATRFLTEGNTTKEFEKSVAEYLGAKHAIAVTSCTTGLHAVLECLNIRGQDVIIPDYTYPATAEAVVLAGGIPVLADVDKKSMNMTSEILEDAYNENMTVCCPVSWAGVPLERELYQTAKKLGLKVLEDAACSLGAKIGTDFVGKIADYSCFSFHPRKVITTGEGGMITTDDDEIAEKCYSFKHFGAKGASFEMIGTNYKLSNVLSAIGLIQMQKLEDIVKMRIEKAKIYRELLSNVDGILQAYEGEGTRQTFQSYTCYVEKEGNRDRIRNALADENIQSQIGTYALHLEPAYKNMKKIGNLENSEALYKNALTLPLHSKLTDEDQVKICNIISEVLK